MRRTCRPAEPSVLDGAVEQDQQDDDELGNEHRHVRQALLTLESKSARRAG
jgi:hypothetical protein